MSTHRSRRRGLSEEEQSLWQRATRAVVPLRARPLLPQASEPVAPELKSKTKPKPVAHAPSSAAVAARLTPAAAPVPAPAPASLGRRQRQRLARGRLEIDGRIDLHGRTQSEAHGALLRFLHSAQRKGARYVLVITGKGARAADQWSERGVLKRQVPLWLAQGEFRGLVVGFEDAHIGHGGEGALYVQVRRAGRR